jgi:hypothetical protein
MTTSDLTKIELRNIPQTVKYHIPTQNISIYGAGARSFCIENIDIIHFYRGERGRLEHFTTYD